MVSTMMFSPPLWLVGAAFTLEKFRRGFIGGSSLALFVVKEFGLDQQAVPTLNMLRGYLDMEEVILAQIEPFLAFLFRPFTDFHEAAKAYLEIIDGLAESQRPRACSYYWKGD